jgi:YVTN family beta-propeller protein
MVGAVAVGLLLGTGSHPAVSRPTAVGEQGLAALDGDVGRFGKLVPLGVDPAAIAPAAGSLWVADPNGGEILRVDPAAGTVVDRIPVSGAPGALAGGGGSIWVATTQPGAVKRIDVATDAVTDTIPLGINPSAIAYGAGAVWIADPSDESLIELDPINDSVRDTVTLTTRPTSIAVGEGAVWIASYDEGTVTEVDPHADVPVARIAVGQGPSALAVGAGSLWVANELDGTVSRIDPQSASVVATLATGSGPAAIAFARGSIWVANEFSRTVSQIDPVSNRVSTTQRSGGAPIALNSMAGTVWAGTRSVAEHRGGTLVLLAHGQFTSMDPALEYEVPPPQLHGLAYDALVAFEHTGGPQGLRLVPDLALALPTAGDAGRTYAFRLRPGIRYATGRPLRAIDIRRAFERLYRLSSPVTTFFGGIAGAGGCGPASCDLEAGIVTDDRLRTVVFHLTKPDPEFLFKLAFVFTAPVPAGTPWHELRTKPFRVLGRTGSCARRATKSCSSEIGSSTSGPTPPSPKATRTRSSGGPEGHPTPRPGRSRAGAPIGCSTRFRPPGSTMSQRSSRESSIRMRLRRPTSC